MIFEMVKSTGIAQNSYFLGSGGSAAVIDPRRDVDIYLELALSHELQIKYIFETHRNEDYTIGSLELAKVTGAQILHGHKMDFAYGTPVYDNDTFNLGSIEIKVLETPGHTLESISITITDKNVSEDVQMVFVGDVLFAGATGRVDFFGESETPNMAHKLHESIYKKILPLGDHVILCPAHGAGSVCGTDIREQDINTIGYEKKTNNDLQLSEEEFIEAKIKEELYYPPYFQQMEKNNKEGVGILGHLPYLTPLTPDEVNNLVENGAQLLDTRMPTSFGGGHIPNSLNIWRDGVGSFSGWFLNYEDPIIIIEDNEKNLNEVLKYLIRIGFDNIYGYLMGGFEAWYMAAREIDKLDMWSVHELKKSLDNKEDLFLLDVRKLSDRKKGHINDSYHIYTGEVLQKLDQIPKNKKIVVYCDSGYKSTLVASLLQKSNYENVKSVLGSMGAWLKAGYPVNK